ncbi:MULTISPECIES: serpin family protein [Streptomyces]|uniref:Serpin family protein n=2 Tax=Streptomyces TaxID=1883 RepID=A0ABU4KIE0_9ACTN|nr:serpin family protein [Streptomyces roseolus]MDX2297570.1 serpin family protein [Streptomyces roseolus]
MTHDSGVPEAEAVRELAARWLPRLGGGDFVVSPVGLWLALGAVASGARGRTGEELRGLLGVGGKAAAEAVTSLGRRLAGGDGLAVATGVWSRVRVGDVFRSRLPDVRFEVFPRADWYELPDEAFGATDDVSLGEVPVDARPVFDAWVREATGGRITRLPLDLDGSEDLVLLNALALKASWLSAFPGRLTRDEPFTDARGATRPVPTMRSRIPARWVWYVDGVTVVELPCREGLRVRFVLGPEVPGGPGGSGGPGAARGPGAAGPAGVLAAGWAGPGERRALGAGAADLSLPRFTLRTTGADVTGHLAALGVSRALGPGADFSGLSADGLYLSRVGQSALVEVAEEGVEAAAVTQLAMPRGAASPRPEAVERIAFDRPFGIVVLDASGELPLFTGWRSGVSP